MSQFIYGIHVVKSVLECDPSCLKKIYILKGCQNKRLLSIIRQVKKFSVVRLVDRHWMDKKTKNAVHQGVIAQIIPKNKYKESDLDTVISHLKSPFLLILDGITDPHNLGACLRSAEAAGINAVIAPKNRSAQLSSIAKKVACGAAENLPFILVTNLVRTLRELQKKRIWIIGTTSKVDRTLYNSKLTGPIALVMGEEGKGMRRLTKEYCDELIRIPMLGLISSLNVSVATGICLFEAVRQRYSF